MVASAILKRGLWLGVIPKALEQLLSIDWIIMEKALRLNICQILAGPSIWNARDLAVLAVHDLGHGACIDTDVHLRALHV